ncbi:hypothetical protein ACFOPN_15235 [Xanthomonas hyacinthi]
MRRTAAAGTLGGHGRRGDAGTLSTCLERIRMSIPSRPSTALAGAVLLGGLGLSASALAMTDLAQGYALGAQAAAPQSASTAATPAPAQAQAKPETKQADAGNAKNAEGKCGAHAQDTAKAQTDTHASAAAHDDKAMAEGKCGEGKCSGGG